MRRYRKNARKRSAPPECEENPVLQILQYHVFPRVSEVVVRRPEKFGGDHTFQSFSEIEEAYRKGEIHPLDLKKTTATYLSDILACVRDHIG